VRRVFWLALGLGAGATAAVLTARWMEQQRRKFGPANVGRQAGQLFSDLGSLIGETVREFRAGASEREAEIRSAIGS
jgi:hypothetical protein